MEHGVRGPNQFQHDCMGAENTEAAQQAYAGPLVRVEKLCPEAQPSPAPSPAAPLSTAGPRTLLLEQQKPLSSSAH